jgi:RHS repeat-associated protein
MCLAPKEEAMSRALHQLFAAFVFASVGCGGQVDPNAGDGDSAAVTLAISLTNQIGRVTAHGNGAAHAFYGYDVRSREVATQHILNGSSYSYAMTYGFPCSSAACTATTAATNGPALVSVKFPDNEVVAYTFDAGGARQSIKSTPSGGTTQTIVSRVLRNSRGQTTEVDYGDGTSTTHHYNDTTDLRVNQIETFLTATPTTILQLYTYAHDHNGNVTGVNDYCNEASTGACSSSAANTTYTASYTYDPRDQLVGTTRAGVAHPYAYDALGNLTNKEGVAQAYFPSGPGKPQPHAVSTVGAVAYHYDQNGNLLNTTGGTANPSITWNADNMPVTLVYSTSTTKKDFVGESLWRKQQLNVTTLYLPSMRVENGLYRKYYESFAERDISDKTTCAVNKTFGCLKFHHGDHLGSSTLVTNAAAAVVHRQAYKPYGEDLVTTAPGPFTPELQYNGMEKEKDGTGFYDYGARLYNPATGRFISPDSVDDGPNRYAYVSNNPLRYTDPTGHAGQGVADQGYEDANGVCHVGPLVPARWVTAAPSLDEVAAQQRALQAQGAELVASLTELQQAPIRAAVLSTLGRVPGAILNGVEAVQDAKDHRWGALTWDLVGLGLSVNPSLPGRPAGSVILTGTEATKNEISAAEIYAKQTGYRVILRDVKNKGQSGRTSDGLVGGWKYRYDIYRPQTANDTNIIRGMRAKRDQAVGIILDLRDSKVDPSKLSNALDRVGGDGHGTFQEIFIIQRDQ